MGTQIDTRAETSSDEDVEKSAQDTEKRPEEPTPIFILYKSGQEYEEALALLSRWVQYLLIPVYGREVSSSRPWCPRWWAHDEAVATLYGLWMAWQDLTGGKAGMADPSAWYRDHLTPVMMALRDPGGPFAGCKPGLHRAKQLLDVEPFPPLEGPDSYPQPEGM
ncbi:DUF4913 domain-containing protein [Streptomyces chartreusis]|uniref:DUF4913 domain-containing protein n=1 Tax=Streptomyces chartreusis TaxID=1969 RepID=UPI0036A00282